MPTLYSSSFETSEFKMSVKESCTNYTFCFPIIHFLEVRKYIEDLTDISDNFQLFSQTIFNE